MLKAITLKEFYKIRWLLAGVLAANLAAVGHVLLETRGLFRAEHAEMVWYQVLQLGRMPWESLQYVPLASGLLLGAAQFLPEMRRERLRLSLHLPLAPHWVVLSLLLMGLTALGAVLLADTLGLRLILSAWFPPEVVERALTTFAPWALSGVMAYLGSGLALLEPAPKFRALYLAMTAGLAALCHHSAVPGAYGPALPVLIVLTALLVPAVLLPAYRYRYRSAR